MANKEKMTVYDYSVPGTDGGELSLSKFKGKVMLIVNTATGCGFTPQYDAIEKSMKRGLLKSSR